MGDFKMDSLILSLVKMTWLHISNALLIAILL